MKISVYRELQNNVFRSRIETSDFSEHDRNLMEDFGEPAINVGGDYHGTRPDVTGSVNLSAGHDWTGANAESFLLTVNSGTPVVIEIDVNCAALVNIVLALNALLADELLDEVVEFYASGNFLAIRTIGYGEDQEIVLATNSSTFLTTTGITAGTYAGAGSPEYHLENSYRRVKSESPFVQGFDVRDEEFEGAAQIKIELWTTTIVSRIKAAMDTLRADSDTYSGESCETY